MQFYVADYLADTMHLTTEENGAYLLLLFNYWQRGHALDNSEGRLANVTRMTPERWSKVEGTLAQFFDVEQNIWTHARIENDLKLVRKTLKKRASAGKASVVARRKARKDVASSEEHPLSERSTHVEQVLSKCSTISDKNRTDKNREEDIPPTPLRGELVCYPDWLNRDLWSKFKATRQNGKTRFTKHAEQLNLNALVKLCPDGLGHEQIIEQTIANGWKSFFPVREEQTAANAWKTTLARLPPLCTSTISLALWNCPRSTTGVPRPIPR
jgi:uncharacterized protein YdaU (DUF1376 family)